MDFDRDEWRTPAWLFRVACERYGPFTLDVAATDENTLCPSFFTKDTDALSQKWPSQDEGPAFGTAVVWCNPPYSNITPWLEHAIECRSEVVFLLPTPNSEKRDRLIFGHATDILFFDRRVAFVQPDGTPKTGNPRGSCLVRFAPLVHREDRVRADLYSVSFNGLCGRHLQILQG